MGHCMPHAARIWLYRRHLNLYFRTRIHNHSTPSERVFCRPAALKNLAIHKVLSAFFRLAGQQNPSPIRHPLIMNTGSYLDWIYHNKFAPKCQRVLSDFLVRRIHRKSWILGKFIYVQAPGHTILAETSASRYPKISWYAFRRYCL